MSSASDNVSISLEVEPVIHIVSTLGFCSVGLTLKKSKIHSAEVA